MLQALCPVLIGREEELSTLEDALLAAHAGQGQVVVLGGEAGMGKTRLASELQQRALKGGMALLWGGCPEAELALPYLPFLEAIGNHLASRDIEHMRQRLGPARHELAHLFPQLEPEGGRQDGGDPAQSKLRLFEAILAFLRMEADAEGMLFVVEDLHWADASTRELVDYLTRRLRSTRVMLLATYRREEVHRKHPLLPAVQAWRRAGVAQVIELEALKPEAVADMVSAIFEGHRVGAEFRDFLHARTDGNPFALEEFLKAALDRGDIFRTQTGWDRKALGELKIPPTVRDSILLRVERLSMEQAEILRTAAVLGRSFAHPTLMAVSGQDRETVRAALQTFVQLQLVEGDPQAAGGYRFRHALTREAVYDDLLAPDREELHARAAMALREQPGTAPVDLAYHLVAAKRWKEAVPVCLTAAEEAQQRCGYREAAQLYEYVLPHLTSTRERGQVLGQLGNAYWLAGDPGKAQPQLEKAIPLLEETGERREASKYRLVLGRCHWERSRPDLARAEYERALAALEPEGPSEDLAYTYLRLSGLDLSQYESAQARAMAERAVAVAQLAGSRIPQIWAYGVIGAASVRMGRIEEGLEYLDRSHREAIQEGLDWLAETALFSAIINRCENFRAREALPLVQLLRGLRGSGAPVRAALAEGIIYGWWLGEPEKAREAYEQALVLAREADFSIFVTRLEMYLAWVHGALGTFDEARRLLPRPEVPGDRQDIVFRLITAIRILLDSGDGDGALREAQTVSERVEWGPLHLERILFDVTVEALLTAGKVGEAERLVVRTRTDDPRDRNPYQRRMEGRLALAKGDLVGAEERLRAAAEFFRAVSYRLEESRTRRALAEVLCQLGDIPTAEAEVRAVLAYARTYGAVFEGQYALRKLSDLGIEAGEAVEGRPQAAVEADLRYASERLVTVLFADVRGYTALSAKEAPHELADKVATLQRWARHEVERHHGLVDKFAGDAVMATFNVSGVRLDHCLHALQAALAIRYKAAYAGVPVGVGIAVGPAIVGQLTQGANVTVAGETTNLAARLQAQAAAGEVLLSREAFRRTRDWLKGQDLAVEEQALSLKGFSEPVVAYRLLLPAARARTVVQQETG